MAEQGGGNDEEMSLDEVQNQYDEYTEQLEVVREALAADPQDEEMLELKTELENVTALTKDLLEMKKREEVARLESARADLKVLHTPHAMKMQDTLTAEGSVSVVPAPKKAYVPKKLVIQPIPKNLAVQPDDSAEEVARKKKRIHVIKSRNRLVEKELEREGKKQNWKDFIDGKGKKKKKKGLVRKRESIFKSPDSLDGRVGVTGSGRGLTENPAKKPKFSKSGELD
mmetsp:Transcript_32608/g.91330  ORF Transcript_32608/g.91330 Transcript_32608/m.91330 type:complete len:227 (-) Transcript_32608:375-1055(-)|eukprot:CAMPEP_0119120910 /NCGR_PEP_ID=MMETSP1310-20130426/1759_1 /TAXON_ID=464262 /ORGANISM="Genus nov. species nov., Strain RCC2339" /LENGTH=226 /DNA_ID=CAMNT_0007110427 /DNA_START=159 /DNA_END=839 /DNA_ORIENTATION=-